ncbi:enoyl-CoA hydratase/isomerase family protein [Zhongshania aliphaticivorans]|uniref:Enoyl-CoA hydratase n=1 Tax=Zhongshania aliphaticivorans TaxID=1470434 RepID=A0A127M1Z8_9GAMM|nr:enoyl-CoA hydratase-related protein [Zhongshania aliphaticivorans]AMO67263.1 hypothetical protein AZF00_02650 [Zhongshania aliphaticivorans]
MRNFETINFSVADRVATISLNRPKAMNAISQLMRQELLKAIEDCEQNENVRIVVIRAEGRGFSAGTDLSEGLAGFDTIEEQIQREYKPVIMGIVNSDKLYISAIHGACAGIGAALAMVCDLAIMADNAYLYLPFAGLGLVPDGGMSHFVVNAMGYKKAIQLFAESGRLPAIDCEKYGFVNKVVSAEDLESEAQSWAATLAKGAPLAQKFTKQIMRSVADSQYVDVLDKEARLQTVCSTSSDSQKAVMAFFEKKEAIFTGE